MYPVRMDSRLRMMRMQAAEGSRKRRRMGVGRCAIIRPDMSASSLERIGPYEVLGLVGAGGMGTVYRARDTRLQRLVAIKIINTDVGEPELARRFESEALAASALNHPNILTVHEFGVHDGHQYLVTEFIEGETLRHRLGGGPLPIADALDIIIQVCSALVSAHAAGLIHRDVKPENVMIRPDGYVKVLDFGLAKLLPASQAAAENMTVSLRTSPGMVLGTMGYMAPEQVRGLDVDQRADAWSVGVVLHEMISGRSPFPGSTSSDVIATVLERPPLPLSRGDEPVPAELERIVGKALAKKREERYQTIKDLEIDLRRLRQRMDAGTAISGSSAPALAPGRRSDASGRRWWPVAAAALVVVALVSVAALGWQRWRSPIPGSASATAASLPLRRVEYWLTVQKIRDGQPYQAPFDSSGQEIFENGWKFRFNLESPEPGFLYLINEGPGSQGVPSLHVLFPTPAIRNGSAAVLGRQPVQTSWYVFDQNQGTEQFWIVWSAREVPEIERAKRWANAADLGQVKDPHEAATLRQLLASYATGMKASKDRATKRTVIEGPADVLASRADLEHH